ncbi:MAG: hypothetical protein J5848_06215 [Bacteroidales bacterium]|nr:hypothetical protein [Bacteroidales bacterium]
MKRAITTLIAAMLLGLAFTACEKEDTTGGTNGSGNNNGPVITDDDTGIELNMRNDGSDEIYFETNYIANDGYTNYALVHLAMSSSNNFYLTRDYGSVEYDIARVGTVAGMSAITSIPTSGWVKQIAVNPGTGYIIRYKSQGFGYTYARLYVKEWLVSTGGGIIGATVVYQDKWGQGSDESFLVGTKWKYTDNEDEITLEFLTESSGTYQFDDIYYDNNDFTEDFTYTYSNTNGTITFSSYEVQWNFHYEGNRIIVTTENGGSAEFIKV